MGAEAAPAIYMQGWEVHVVVDEDGHLNIDVGRSAGTDVLEAPGDPGHVPEGHMGFRLTTEAIEAARRWAMPEQLTPGKRYRIAREGGGLADTVPVGPGTYTGTWVDLAVGDVVTYDGESDGWGCDPIPVPQFTVDGGRRRGRVRGTFWPNDFGRLDLGFFAEMQSDE